VRIVLDVSVAVKWFIDDEEYIPESLAIYQALRFRTMDVCAPHTTFAEFGHALRGAFLTKRVPHARLLRACHIFERTPIEFVAVRGFTADAMNLAVKHDGSYYDALYVALAIQDDIKVVTADEPMMNAFAKLDRCIHVKDFKF